MNALWGIFKASDWGINEIHFSYWIQKDFAMIIALRNYIVLILQYNFILCRLPSVNIFCCCDRIRCVGTSAHPSP